MLNIKIPGRKEMRLNHLVLDYNGTIAEDGELLPGVQIALTALAKKLEIHVITADTHGTVRDKLKGLPCFVEIIGEANQDDAKCEFVKQLGADGVIAIGNGRNDILMLQKSVLGICLMQREGCSSQAIASAAVVCTSIIDAFNLLLIPKRLIATLRN